MYTRRQWTQRLLYGLGSSRVLHSQLLSDQRVELPAIGRMEFQVPLTSRQGEIVCRYPANASCFRETLDDGVTLEMALIPGGAFDMGSEYPTAVFNLGEKPIHRVSVKPFALGAFPVTRRQFAQISKQPQINGPMVSYWGLTTGLDLPIDALPMASVQEFLARLRALTGRPYRLPAEAEWEYACRAGTTTAYHFGDGISRSVVNYGDGGPPSSQRQPVGSLNAPNRFGLHDMHGAVMEHCADLVNFNYSGAPTDGSAWTTSPHSSRYQVARGGCFLFSADAVRSGRRHFHGTEVTAGLGFRVALSLDHGTMDPIVDRNQGLVNAGSKISGPIAPGEIVIIEGQHFSPGDEVLHAFEAKVPFELEGVRVRMNGMLCPVLSVSESAIRVVAPYELAGQQEAQVIVETRAQSAMPAKVRVTESAPGLFTVDQSGRGLISAANEDGSTHSESHPAARGSRLSLFGTGEGQTDPPGVNGRIADPGAWPIPRPVLPVAVRIGGVECEILYAGGESGQIAGLLRVDVRVPAELPNLGILPVVMQIGAASSQDEVFVAVG